MTQTFDTSWDIEQYRTKFECEEHWGLKRDFMLKYKDTFPEERLACLSQVFVNIELMRCRYPNAVMRQVAELAKDVSSQYRKSRKNLLQRTFVKASDAANAKVKGEKRSHPENKPEKLRVNFVGFNQSSTSSEQSRTENQPEKQRVNFVGFNQSSVESEKQDTVEKNNSKYVIPPKRSILDRLGPSTTQRDTLSSEPLVKKGKGRGENINSEFGNVRGNQRGKNLVIHPLSDVIILLHAYSRPGSQKIWQVLQSSLCVTKREIQIENKSLAQGKIKCILYIDGIFVSHAVSDDAKEAKFEAAKKALQSLSECCYTLKVLKPQASDTAVVGLDVIGDAPKMSKESTPGMGDGIMPSKSEAPKEDNSIGDDNIGSRLLRLMGWTGGGLGKSGEGIVEPVKAVEVVKRQGLGASEINCKGLGGEGGEVSLKFKRNVRNELISYCSSDRDDDLIFSEDLSNPQRAAIHLMVRREFGKLVSKSYGKKGGCRRLAITRRFRSKLNLVEHLLKNGGKTDKYEVYLPGTLDIVQECMSLEFCPEEESC